jgi:hypothetical protein
MGLPLSLCFKIIYNKLNQFAAKAAGLANASCCLKRYIAKTLGKSFTQEPIKEIKKEPA